MGKAEAVNQRRTENITSKRERTKRTDNIMTKRKRTRKVWKYQRSNQKP